LLRWWSLREIQQLAGPDQRVTSPVGLLCSKYYTCMVWLMTTSAAQIPMVGYLVLGGDGPPHLGRPAMRQLRRHFSDRRNACASCGLRAVRDRAGGDTGMLRSFTIVHRAAPNVPAPYISAVVELDGGGVIKANLVTVDPTR